MASKRDTLIKTFQARNRRKPGGIDQGFPKGGTSALKPGKTSPTVDTKLYRSRVPPPPSRVKNFGEVGPPIPGVGGVAKQRFDDANFRYDHPANDGARPGGPHSRYGAVRGTRKRTRPTPGSAYRKNRPTLN